MVVLATSSGPCDVQNADILLNSAAAPAEASDHVDRLVSNLNLGKRQTNILPAISSLKLVQRLFDALKDRDSSTAAHSLRTTLGCARWAERLKLTSAERDAVETAALLHDIGKLALPDRILRKPGPLTDEEKSLVDLCRRTGLELIREKVALPSVSEIVSFSQAWYDGSHNRAGLKAQDIPFGARMLAIVDAFDAMTSDQVYRPALPIERALAELQRCAGKQFDPQLVQHLCDLPPQDLYYWHESIRKHADSLKPSATVSGLNLPDAHPLEIAENTPPLPLALFQEQLMENLREAVVFFDCQLRIVYWSRGAARLTGLTGREMIQKKWLPSLLGMRDGRGVRLPEAECPVLYSMNSGKQWTRRILVKACNRDQIAVEAQVMPVHTSEGATVGAILLMRDLSHELTFRDQCVNLQQLIMRDALTQVANRAEFDRVHAQAIKNHAPHNTPYSLILCDIDHFKQVNDNFGHQTGDAVLKRFAKMLEANSRAEDLVARYGGEEFAVLCPDCDVENATRRAEALRSHAAAETHPEVGSRQITASFGVTALQPGDTPEKMLERADKALYQAKHRGRNTVVTSGPSESTLADGVDPESAIRHQIITGMPFSLMLEKMRGFITDHRADVVTVEPCFVRLSVDAALVNRNRRATDRRLECFLDIRLEEEGSPAEGTSPPAGGAERTKILLSVTVARSRDRRRREALGLAKNVMSCFRAYLMVGIDHPTTASVNSERS